MDREASRANQPPAGHRLRGAHNKDQPPFPKGTLNCQPWQGKLIFTITWIPSLQHNVNRIPLSQLWTQEMLQAAVPQLTSLCREKVHQGHGSACVNLDYTQMWTKCFKLRSLALTNHLSFSRLRHKGYCDEHYLRFMGLGCLSFTQKALCTPIHRATHAWNLSPRGSLAPAGWQKKEGGRSCTSFSSNPADHLGPMILKVGACSLWALQFLRAALNPWFGFECVSINLFLISVS